jgi:hypothetical protein
VKDTARLQGLRQEVNIHARKLSPMTADERHRYLHILMAGKTTSASEADMRAMLMTRLRELKLWPPRIGFM